MALSQQFFDDFVPIGASCNTNQHTDTFDQYYTNASTNTDDDADADNTGVLENLVPTHIPWSTAPPPTTTTTTATATTTTATSSTTMPRNSNGAIEVPAHDDPSSWNEKSLSPTRRSSTRTPSISSSHKSSISRASVSSKSSAPSADDSTSKRRTRSAASAGSGSGINYSSSSSNNHNKRDKFLERNRVAASKCRQRKKEWVSGLEEAKNGLEAQNSHLQMELNGLLGEVSRMKNQIMAHASCHDPNIDKWIDNEARRFVQGPEVADYAAGAAAVGYDSFGGPGAAPPFPPMGYQGFDEGTTRLSPAETIMSEMPGRLDDAERTRMCMRHPEAVSG